MYTIKKAVYISVNCFAIICGESRIRTCEDVVSGFTVRPRWPLEYLTKISNKKPLVRKAIVTGLGLEPRTLSLKGRCSTN